MSQHKRWCFTTWYDNEPTWDPGIMQYITCQKEKTPKTNKYHWQGYIEFKKTIRMSRVKFYLGGFEHDGGNSIHLEVAKGTAAENIKYCSKEETRVYLGITRGHPYKTSQGKRTDLDELKRDCMDESKTELDIAISNQHYIRHHRYVQRMRYLCGGAAAAKEPFRKRTVVWYFGPPCTGKSRRAMYEAQLTGASVYRKSSDTKWWDGYDKQQHVVIDDISIGATGMSLGTWKRLLDGYPEQVEVKNGFRPWMATSIWITSNHSPENWIASICTNIVDQIALRRRITTTIEFITEWKPPEPLDSTMSLGSSSGDESSGSSTTEERHSTQHAGAINWSGSEDEEINLDQ